MRICDSRQKTRAAFVLACVAAAFLSQGALADTYWKTTPLDDDWRNDANWTAGKPGTSDVAYFTSSSITSVKLSAFKPPPYQDGRALGINFSGGSDFTISPGIGGVLYTYLGGVTADGGNQKFTCQVRPSADGVFPIANNGAGLLSFSGDLMSQPNVEATLTFSGVGNVMVDQLIRRYTNASSNMDVVMNGTGTLTIQDPYPIQSHNGTPSGYGYTTGTTTINSGTISIDEEGCLGGNPGGYVDATNTWIPGSFDADALLLDGGTLKATASFAIDDSNRGVTVGASGGTFEVETGDTLTISNSIAGSGGLTKTGAGTLTLSGAVSNTYSGLTTVSGGTLSLGKTAGVDAIAGDVLVNGGTLSFAAANQIADTSSITVDTGVFSTNSKADTVANVTINCAPSIGSYHTLSWLTVTGTLQMTAGTSVLNSGTSATATTVIMSGGSVFSPAANNPGSTFNIGSGGLTMSGATLQMGYPGGTPTCLVNLGGNFTGSGTNNISTPNNNGPRLLDLQGATRTFNVTSGTTTISPTVQNGGLTKTGGGTLILSGSSTYTGGTTASGGILRLGADDVLADTGAVTVGGGTLDINTRNDTVGAFTLTSGSVTGTTGVLTAPSFDVRSGIISAALGGSGTLTKTTGGTVTLSGTSPNTYGGLTTVSGGMLRLDKTAGVDAIAGDIVVNSGTLRQDDHHQIANTSDITVNGSANFDNGGRTDTVANVTLNSSYSNPGDHRVSNMTITGTLKITDGAVGLNSGATTNAGTLEMSGGSRMDFAANGNNTTINVGSGGLTMSGATIHMGWTTLPSPFAARVNLGGDFTGSGTNLFDYYSVNGPRLLDLRAATRTFNITGGTTTIDVTVINGGLTKTGDGTLILTAGDIDETSTGSGVYNYQGNTYAGGTTVSGGTLLANNPSGSGTGSGAVLVNGGTLGGTGTIAGLVTVDSGTIAPGTSTGELRIGSVVFKPESFFDVQINNNIDFDVLTVGGSATLAGTLVLHTPPGFDPPFCKEFVVLRAADELLGEFDELDTSDVNFASSAMGWEIVYDYDAYTVTLHVVPEPATLTLLGLGAIGLLLRRRRK